MQCPFCKKEMNHQKMENVWVDLCQEHGMWLDKGEVEIIMEAAKKRGEGEGFVNSLWTQTTSF